MTVNERHILVDNVSPSEANTFSVRGFKNKQKLNNHWQKHIEEYRKDGIKTKDQYLNRALELAESPTSKTILGHIDGSGNVIRYDTEKNDFVKGKSNEGILTFFKPKEGKKYSEVMKKEDIANGGKT